MSAFDASRMAGPFSYLLRLSRVTPCPAPTTRHVNDVASRSDLAKSFSLPWWGYALFLLVAFNEIKYVVFHPLLAISLLALAVLFFGETIREHVFEWAADLPMPLRVPAEQML